VEKAVKDGSDIISHTVIVQQTGQRKTVADTDMGKELKETIRDLEELLAAYREGSIVEKDGRYEG
jgi:fructose-1,6-bisphosphatase-3